MNRPSWKALIAPETLAILCAFAIACLNAPLATAQEPKPGAGATTRPADTQPADTAPLPSAEEVIEKFLEATGGREAYGKIHNRLVKGTMSMPQQNLKGSLQSYTAEPDKMYTLLEIAGVGKQEQGTKDGIGWEMSDMRGARLIEGVELAELIRTSTFNAEMKWKDLYKSAECTARETVNGRPTYKVVFTPKIGPESAQYFDTETHLLIQTRGTLTTEMGELPTVSTLSDYREIDGVKLPMKTVQAIPGIAQIEIVLQTVEHNLELPDDRFDPPADVKMLLEKKKQTGDTKPGATTQPSTAPKASGGK
jgi:hypothetical protein